MTGDVVVHGLRQRVGTGVPDQPRHRRRHQLRGVDGDDDRRDPRPGIECPEPRAQRRRHPRLPVGDAHDLDPGGYELLGRVGPGSERDGDVAASALSQRAHGEGEPRRPGGGAGEGLGAAETATRTRGEDESRDGDGGLGGHGHDSVACAKHAPITVVPMLDLAADLVPLLDAGVPLAAVTVTAVVRSAPRGVGASLVVTRDARVIGSISGGCVENDAVMLGLDALRTGAVRRARFGFTDDGTVTPIAAGLACGGAVDVVAYPLDESVRPALDAAREGRRARVRLDLDGEPLVLERVAAPRLIILGAGEHAAALCRLGAAAGFRVTVCDDWALLATRERFPDAAEVVVAAPHDYLATLDDADERTAVCVLTHDERLDVPALRAALRMPVGFVGAMGARATVARRAQLLRHAGVTDAELARLHSPLGLDLGGASPEETALSVVAEIVASRHAADARPLREGSAGRLHRGEASSTDAAASCAARSA